MDLDRHLCRAAHRLYHHLPVGQLRHEHAIHDVEMDRSSARLLESGDLCGQMTEVAQQEGRKNDGATTLDPDGESVS